MPDLTKLIRAGAEAEPYIGAKAKTQANWRVLGIGPKYIRAGGKIYYDPADIAVWRASRRVQSTSELAA